MCWKVGLFVLLIGNVQISIVPLHRIRYEKLILVVKFKTEII